ncbi:hypothetical protein M3N64_00960 [Sporolactobacillus sp. CPB3-1]|uniref:Uncharacterized protein n=1 Tax=Sporolactobacillus mangiferae TaxID=2940498 RepID=A0ABT0M6M6_9BACL|nr:hypothetical protein [Sporolactobacillus mangiferae]MCL1630522.1 hypothetical protein [Sporolactobacillus mangiferae]
MIDDHAAVLSAAAAHFNFGRIRVVSDQPLLIETERGMKKIRVWENNALLKIHLKWRERVSGDQFLVDRMYVTRAGYPLVRLGRLSVTCHDAPSLLFKQEGNEKTLAQLIDYLFQNSRGIPAEKPVGSYNAYVHQLYEQTKNSESVQQSEIWSMVSACFSSACARAETADRLRKAHHGRSTVFLLPEDFSYHSFFSLFDTIFFEIGQSRPVNGYGRIAAFFLDKSLMCSEQSMHRLFEAVRENGSMDREMVDLLLAEWYEPAEWVRLLHYGASSRVQDNDLIIQEFRKIWDRKIKLIKVFESIVMQP